MAYCLMYEYDTWIIEKKQYINWIEHNRIGRMKCIISYVSQNRHPQRVCFSLLSMFLKTIWYMILLIWLLLSSICSSMLRIAHNFIKPSREFPDFFFSATITSSWCKPKIRDKTKTAPCSIIPPKSIPPENRIEIAFIYSNHKGVTIQNSIRIWHQIIEGSTQNPRIIHATFFW